MTLFFTAQLLVLWIELFLALALDEGHSVCNEDEQKKHCQHSSHDDGDNLLLLSNPIFQTRGS